MDSALLLWLLLAVPIVTAGVCVLMPTARAALACSTAGVIAAGLLGGYAAARVFSGGPLSDGSLWLRLDALSAFHLAVMALVYTLSSLFAWVYFSDAEPGGGLSLKQARRFGALWCGALASMTLLLLSNNLGLMWVGMEATTLLTAFLISLHSSRESLEAMWKYILICSIGVALAFLGTLLMAAASMQAGLGSENAMLWTELRTHASLMDPVLTKAAFILLVVGFGTKAGLAPVHNWLPDAHSQAPAPVSAMFSGFMLSAAMYCIMRYLPVVEVATGGTGWGRELILGFGLVSIGVAAAFISFQTDLKRLLAYHSVEHLGIIAVGLGLGGFGVFAALFHTLNHALSKSLAFFAAGRLGQSYGGYDLERMRGALRVSPLWGWAILVSLLTLLGAAPFAIFMSEFQILWAAIGQGAYLTATLFLLGAGIVFAGAFGHVISLVFGHAPAGLPRLGRGGSVEWLIVLLPLALLLGLGLWMPPVLQVALERASAIVGGDVGMLGSAMLGGGSR